MDYPINLKLRGRRVFIIGGGRVAQRRVEALLEAEARITVISPALTDGLAAAAAAGTFSHVAAKYTAGAIAALTAEYGEAPRLVIVATPDETANKMAADEAHSKNILVNMAAPPMEESDFIVPARIQRGSCWSPSPPAVLAPLFPGSSDCSWKRPGLRNSPIFSGGYPPSAAGYGRKSSRRNGSSSGGASSRRNWRP